MIQFVIACILLLSSAVFASETIRNTVTENSISQNTVIQSSDINKASVWGLNESEWKQYIMLMQGPSGRYYPNLTPLEVLGINADNEEDLKHFSELAVTHEHEKVEKELRFNAAFLKAAERMYGNEPVVRPFDYSRYSTISK
jgi:integrating conjugative element protein (TIGR03759 family)